MKIIYRSICLLMLVFIADQFAQNLSGLEIDKARYNPGDKVKFGLTIDGFESNLELRISYYSLDKKISNESISIVSDAMHWEWLPPADDFRGYLVNVELFKNGISVDSKSIAVDVSSNWKKFPRYGFLSSFNPINPRDISSTIDHLNRFHINGLQFYDWQYKHHKPLKGTGDDPAITWNDIANRTVYLPTLRNYIDTAHSRNMMAMAYNLIYGAYEDAEIDGVSNQWRIFTDANHITPDKHDLPDSWASDIYLINPSNLLWQEHIVFETSEAFKALDFDGWHVDQLGDRGARYDYTGDVINLPNGFQSLLAKAKTDLDCSLVMNAVGQYAQTQIADSPVDFLYSEVWEPNTTYDKLAKVILENDTQTNGELRSVLAAYIHKAISNLQGEFNTPAVLYADAVIFGFGGCHLELGEHMLSNEYFPSDNITVSEDLKEELIKYYDFMVAYQNYLRGNGDIINDQLQTSGSLSFIPWARSFNVWNFGREYENKKVFQLINFSDASTLDWRDNNADQTAPVENFEVPVFYETDKTVYKVWMASPDYKDGLPFKLDFKQEEGKVSFNLPYLKYWDMVVIDFDSTTSIDEVANNPARFELMQNYPNPFNPSTTIRFNIPSIAHADSYLNAKINIFDLLGRKVETIENKNISSGIHEVKFSGKNLTSGIYYYQLIVGEYSQIKKMVLIK